MISFIVKGMNCGHCAKKITQAVKTLDPMATLTIDVAEKRVDINSSLPSSDFEAAINALDYFAIPA